MTSKSRRLGERLKATTGKMLKNVFAVVRREQQIEMFSFYDVRDLRE